MTEFKSYLEDAKQIPITNVFRFSQELIDIATDFIKDRKYPLTMSLEHAVKRIKRAIDKKKHSKIYLKSY